jgi:hypothetical protein
VWLQHLSKIFDLQAHAVCFCILVAILDLGLLKFGGWIWRGWQ